MMLVVGPVFALPAHAPTRILAGPTVVPIAHEPVPVPPRVLDIPKGKSRALAGGQLSARSSKPVLRVYRRPTADSGIKYAVETHNPWGQPLEFLVVDTRKVAGKTWLKLMVGVQPNGASGWIAVARVKVRPVQDRITVDMSSHILRRFHEGHLKERFQIAIGAPGTPTTPGLFFVWAKVPSEAGGPYGAYALGLSGFSEVLTSWPGGGRMAIHGTDDPSDVGEAVSHGCVRVFNPQMLRLRDVDMGTPVLIRP